MSSTPTSEPLDRNRRFEILAQTDADPLRALAEEILDERYGQPVTVVTPPRAGTLMLRLREPVQGDVFNAGEVLVTEAAVIIDGQHGYGMRLGREPEATLAAAILDAAAEANHPLAPRIAALLRVQVAVAQEREDTAWQEIAPTRVVFEEMHQ